MWTAVKDDRGLLVGPLGVAALGLYGVVAAFQPENEFDRSQPDRYDLLGAGLSLVGVGVIMYWPR